MSSVNRSMTTYCKFEVDAYLNVGQATTQSTSEADLKEQRVSAVSNSVLAQASPQQTGVFEIRATIIGNSKKLVAKFFEVMPQEVLSHFKGKIELRDSKFFRDCIKGYTAQVVEQLAIDVTNYNMSSMEFDPYFKIVQEAIKGTPKPISEADQKEQLVLQTPEQNGDYEFGLTVKGNSKEFLAKVFELMREDKTMVLTETKKKDKQCVKIEFQDSTMIDLLMGIIPTIPELIKQVKLEGSKT